LDSTGSGQGPVAGSCESGDEPSGSCATELVTYSHSYSFCASRGRSALATRVIVARVSRGGWGSQLHGDGTSSGLMCVPY
jgi:hypothetical protein